MEGQVLPIESCTLCETLKNAANDGDISQMTAEEYLLWVRLQANEIPSVVRVIESNEKHQESKFESNGTNINQFESDANWQIRILETFEKQRQSLANAAQYIKTEPDERIPVPALKNKTDWYEFCFGKEACLIYKKKIEQYENLQRKREEIYHALDLNPSEEDGEEDGEIVDKALPRKKVKRMSHEIKKCIEGNILGEPSPGVEHCKTSLDQTPMEDDIDLLESNADAIDDNASNNDFDSVNDCVHADNSKPVSSSMFVSGASCSVYYPSKRILLQFDQVMAQRLLCYIVDWLEEISTQMMDPMELQYNHIYYMCAWVYGLLARVELPLHRDICASIRSLCKTSIALKSKFNNYIHTHDLACDHELFKYIPLFNVNILISGVYFGQGIDLIKENNEVHAWRNKCHAISGDEDDDRMTGSADI